MPQQEKQDRMRELVDLLNKASKAYYAQDDEIMTNYEYDRLYEELVQMEKETGVIFSDSPTVNVGYEAVDELPKETHEKPMLSLGKTKSREELTDWIGEQEGLLSWKLDGLTVVLSYSAGKLAKAVTRGNGEVGEVISNNARCFKNIPLTIPFLGDLVLRGEAVISYSDFETINQQIEQVEARYKNPRNLCSGSVRQLNNEITAKRNVKFFAFSLVKAEGMDFSNSVERQFLFLKEQGFEIVPYLRVNKKTIAEAISRFEKEIETYDIPSDGLVLTYDDIAYGISLGLTAKYPRNAIAFKWADETQETNLLEIEWSPSRTGLINPVAVFEPVELEGTTVSRASVHNISVMRSLKLGVGDRILVYKANMIIPQIAENLTKSDSIEIPIACPVCGGDTKIHDENGVQTLYCTNPACAAKKLKAFTLFVSRDAMNIDGLSEATLEKFIGQGFIHEFADIYHLDRHKDVIVQMEGFGEKSYQKLWDSIQKSRKTVLPRLLYSLGIEGIGLATAKLICRHFDDNLEVMKTASEEELSEIEKVGPVLAASFCAYFRDENNLKQLQLLVEELAIEVQKKNDAEQTLTGLSFVVTGSLNHYANRDILKEEIEKLGGKVTGSVTGKTTCLINNDSMSNSSKNKKAKELGIPILTEDEFLERYMKSM